MSDEYKEILLSLIASLSLTDNSSDVVEDCITALKRVGLDPAKDDVNCLDEIGPWLSKRYGVRTLYGTDLYDPDDDLDEAE